MARNYFIDAAKGLSIILVVANHSYLVNWFEEFIRSLSMVRMPLFFFLSGIFFKFSDTPVQFFNKKFSSLLKPYLVYGLFLAIVLPFIGRGEFWEHIYGVVWATRSEFLTLIVLWFLPHLFAVYCLAYVVLRNVTLDALNVKHYLVLGGIYIVGLLLLESIQYKEIGIVRNSGLPFSIDVALVSLPLFLMGKMLRQKVVDFTPSLPIFGITAIIFALATFMGGFLDLYYRVSSAPLFVFFGSLSGIYVMLYLVFYATKASIVEKTLVAIGKNSLFILLFHALILSLARNKIQAIESDLIGIAITLTSIGIAVIISVVAGIIIRKVAPLRVLFVPATKS